MAVCVGTKGYLYSRWRGKFEVFEGYIEVSRYASNHSRFVYRRGRKEKTMQCSPNPGEVYNSVVWLTERDDELAKKMFIEYEEFILEELREKIEKHEQAIEKLKGLDMDSIKLAK